MMKMSKRKGNVSNFYGIREGGIKGRDGLFWGAIFSTLGRILSTIMSYPTFSCPNLL